MSLQNEEMSLSGSTVCGDAADIMMGNSYNNFTTKDYAIVHAGDVNNIVNLFAFMISGAFNLLIDLQKAMH